MRLGRVGHIARKHSNREGFCAAKRSVACSHSTGGYLRFEFLCTFPPRDERSWPWLLNGSDTDRVANSGKIEADTAQR